MNDDGFTKVIDGFVVALTLTCELIVDVKRVPCGFGEAHVRVVRNCLGADAVREIGLWLPGTLLPTLTLLYLTINAIAGDSRLSSLVDSNLIY
ncbi:hypothetical protein ES702_03060 [subsurface metagenome]